MVKWRSHGSADSWMYWHISPWLYFPVLSHPYRYKFEFRYKRQIEVWGVSALNFSAWFRSTVPVEPSEQFDYRYFRNDGRLIPGVQSSERGWYWFNAVLLSVVLRWYRRISNAARMTHSIPMPAIGQNHFKSEFVRKIDAHPVLVAGVRFVNCCALVHKNMRSLFGTSFEEGRSVGSLLFFGFSRRNSNASPLSFDCNQCYL